MPHVASIFLLAGFWVFGASVRREGGKKGLGWVGLGSRPREMSDWIAAWMEGGRGFESAQ